MTVRTPDRNSIPAKQFCHEINPSSGPEYISITPEPGCEPNDCFNCVRQKVERAGGRTQYGWAIWEWPGVYIETEHHAGDAPRLFLRDDAEIRDFQNGGVLRDNRQQETRAKRRSAD